MINIQHQPWSSHWGKVTQNTAANILTGGTGNDTYLLGTGDTIVENASAGTDTVNTSATYTLGTHLENLMLTGSANINGTGNASNNSLTGNSGNNTLTGNAGADTLSGGTGTDTLNGGIGNDIYQLGRGDGSDTVIDTDSTAGNTDIAQFGTDIAKEQLWFQQVNNNLEISIIGTNDKMIVQNWYGGSSNRVEQIQTNTGGLLIEARVQNLVQAMAAFNPPAMGQTTLPPDYETALLPVIAANWQ